MISALEASAKQPNQFNPFSYSPFTDIVCGQAVLRADPQLPEGVQRERPMHPRSMPVRDRIRRSRLRTK